MGTGPGQTPKPKRHVVGARNFAWALGCLAIGAILLQSGSSCETGPYDTTPCSEQPPASYAGVFFLAAIVGFWLIPGPLREGAEESASDRTGYEGLEKLAALRERGAITDAEYEEEKGKVLGNSPPPPPPPPPPPT